MLGYANEEALTRTMQTGTAWFFSRSRQKLWNKGETSGNFIFVKKILSDCDDDTLIYVGTPKGRSATRATAPASIRRFGRRRRRRNGVSFGNFDRLCGWGCRGACGDCSACPVDFQAAVTGDKQEGGRMK